ncbi:TPA: flagellar basal body rod protein [Candidatus Sumerlaeota bacterium]|nr:flagellar basal body rod protein [Candidatus Sumerlaeota bacterium]
MLDALNTSLSGLRAQTRKFEAHAQNIANSTTTSYTPVDAVLESDSTGGVTAQIQTRQSDEGVDISEELVGMMSSERAYQANVAVLRTSNQTLGVLLDTHA